MTSTSVTLDAVAAMKSAVLTMSEVASLLGVDGRTVSRACAEGQIPFVHVGRRTLIPRLRLLEMLGASADGVD